MDSEGIWNACTMNVITNIAITTVPISDCREPIRSELKLLAARGLGAGAAAGAGSRGSVTMAGGSTGIGIAGGSVCETVGWFRESIKNYLSTACGDLALPSTSFGRDA